MHQTELVEAIVTLANVLEPHALTTLHQRLTKMLENDMYTPHQSGGGVPSSFRGGGQRDHPHSHHPHHHPMQPHQHHHHNHRGRGGGGFSDAYMPDRRRFNDYRDNNANNANGNGMRYPPRGGYGGGRQRGGGRFRNDDNTTSSAHRSHDNLDARKWRNDDATKNTNANAAIAVYAADVNTGVAASEGDRHQQRKTGNKRRDKRRPNNNSEDEAK